MSNSFFKKIEIISTKTDITRSWQGL